MAVPKKRVSLTRRRLRRTHHKIEMLARGTCSHCKALKPNFNVCTSCGHYKGVKYIDVQEKMS